MTRIGVITQARMTSTRLPGKVMITIGGRTLLDHHLERLNRSGYPTVVATTTNTGDDLVADAAATRGARVFRGSEHDVLSRFAGAAAAAELDVVVRVTSDCPLIDPTLIESGVERFLALDDEDAHVSNVIHRTYPRGFDFEVFSAEALLDADRNATDPADREHVTPYLYRNRSGRVSLHAIHRARDASQYRVTVDTHEDLSLMQALIEQHRADSLSVDGIIDVLDSHPELARLNAHVEQKKLGD